MTAATSATTGLVRSTHWRWAAPLIVAIVAVDQLTKAMILANPTFRAVECLRDRSIPCGGIELSSVFDLTMTWNRGVSYGLLQAEGAGRWLLVLLTTAIAVGFAIWLLRADRRLTALALALVVGGAVGNNLIDRVRFGAVIDFLDFGGPWFGWRIGGWDVGFPWIFNIADAAISVGAIVLLLDQLLAGRREGG